MSRSEYESGIAVLGSFSTVRDFWRKWSAVYESSIAKKKLPERCNLLMFKSGIKPTWEDPLNASGGRWVSMKTSLFSSSSLQTNFIAGDDSLTVGHVTIEESK